MAEGTAEVTAITTSIWFGAAGAVPYVYVSGTQGSTGGTIPIGLDDVFAAGKTPSVPWTTGALTLQKGTGQSPTPYQIVAGPGAWDFSTNRSLRADFDAMLAYLDAQGLKGGRLAIVRAWLAQALPQTFGESLYFRYGFDPANRCVDLLPGMRLRFEYQAHQAVDPAASGMNGFVGTGTSYAEVVQTPSSQYGVVTGLNPFLSALQGFSVPAAQTGGGGPVDLAGTAAAPYWRLLYPQTFPASDGTGFAGPQQNAVLLGAATWADMVAASAQYAKDGTVPGTSLFLRGRATVVPEVPMFFENERQWVTLGTTVRHLLSGIGPVPWLKPGQPGFARVSGVQAYNRAYTPLVNSGGNVTWTVGGYAGVQFDRSAYGCWGDNLDAFDLPVAGGDVLTLQTIQ